MRKHGVTLHGAVRGLSAAAAFFLVVSASAAAAQDGYYGQGVFSSGNAVVNAVPVGNVRAVEQGDAEIRVRESLGNDMGFAVPDTNGDFIWTPAPRRGSSAVPAEARELRLKVRELADQLVAGMDPAYRNHVALPTTFVSQDDFSRTSTLGRFMVEQLLYEFNQRGFPVREYRLGKALRTNGKEGDFLLEHARRSVSPSQSGVVFVVGTYLADRQAIFVNARLVRGNGHILRTAQLVMPNTSITRRMLMSGGSGKTGSIQAQAGGQGGRLPIEDFRTVTQPVNATPIDRGEDIH